MTGNIWYPSLYDMDCTWGTTLEGEKAESYTIIPQYDQNKLITRTVENFTEELENRWFELRQDILTRNNILDEFYEFINSIPEETKEKEKTKYNEIPGYGIDQISIFVNNRLKFIDNLMEEKIPGKSFRKTIICILITISVIFIIGLIIKKKKNKNKEEKNKKE